MAAEPTITLTQSEYLSVIRAATAEGMAAHADQEAAPVMDKVRKAFAPAQPAQPPAPALKKP